MRLDTGLKEETSLHCCAGILIYTFINRLKKKMKFVPKMKRVLCHVTLHDEVRSFFTPACGLEQKI